MRREPLFIGLITCFAAAGLVPVGYDKAESAFPAIAQAAKELALVTQENADRATLAAVIAEKQAGRAGPQSPAARRAEVVRELSELKARETEQGLVLTLGDVFFGPDQFEPAPAALRKLSPLVAILKDQPERKIRIAGYTDSRGPESYNLDLSQRRAGAVRDVLIENGIAPQRITARGYGEAVSAVWNTRGAGRQEDRRVEVMVVR